MRLEINPKDLASAEKFKFVTKGQREVEGTCVSEEISQWVSSIIGFDVVLVRGPNVKVNRNPVEEKYAFRVNEAMSMHVGFSDMAVHFMS